MNKRVRKNNRTGITGVYWDKERSRYAVTIRNKYLSAINDFFEACYIRKSAEKKTKN